MGKVSQAKDGRVYSVEYLRIIFTIGIVLFHVCRPEAFPADPTFQESLARFFGSGKKLFDNAGKIVDYFFVIGGFFLFQRRHIATRAFIGDLYVRLAPAFLVAIALVGVFSSLKPHDFFLAVSMLDGLSLSKYVIGAGDWFIGVYFWVSVLYFLILNSAEGKSVRIVPILVMTYCALSLAINGDDFLAQKDRFILDQSYLGLFGVGLVRGIYGVGFGVLVAYLSDHLKFPRSKKYAFLYSAIEILLIAFVFWDIARDEPMGVIQAPIAFCLLLISMTQSLGVVSKKLNKWAGVMKVSRYCYGVFVFQALMIHFLWWRKDISAVEYAGLVFAGAIGLGVLTHHLVEKPIFARFKKREA